MKSRVVLPILLLSFAAFAQEKIFYGKIEPGGNNVEGINIVNLVNEKSAVSNANGDFHILAKAEDLLQLSLLFSDEYFSETLKIHSENVTAFQYFAIEDLALINSIEMKNKTLSSLRMIQLSDIYKELQADEN